MLGGQLFGPGGNSTPEYWIDGRPIRAAPKAPQGKGGAVLRRPSIPIRFSSLCAPSAWRVDFIALLEEAEQSSLDQVSAQRTETHNTSGDYMDIYTVLLIVFLTLGIGFVLNRVIG
jgi:hypothetical protein